MKQHITDKQLNELSKKGMVEYGMWIAKKKILDTSPEATYPQPIPLLSIGQMIEFLDENEAIEGYHYDARMFLPCRFDEIDKLCDKLWEAVKEVLK